MLIVGLIVVDIISKDTFKITMSKTVRTVQRALVSLTEKGHIRRVREKKNSTWGVLKYATYSKCSPEYTI